MEPLRPGPERKQAKNSDLANSELAHFSSKKERETGPLRPRLDSKQKKRTNLAQKAIKQKILGGPTSAGKSVMFSKSFDLKNKRIFFNQTPDPLFMLFSLKQLNEINLLKTQKFNLKARLLHNDETVLKLN